MNANVAQMYVDGGTKHSMSPEFTWACLFSNVKLLPVRAIVLDTVEIRFENGMLSTIAISVDLTFVTFVLLVVQAVQALVCARNPIKNLLETCANI